MENKMKNKINPYIIKDIAVIVVSSILFYYVNELETSKCLCSKDWKRDYIKFYSAAIIILLLLSLFTPIFTNNIIIKDIISLGGLVNIGALYIYIRELQNNECVCAIEKHKYIYEFLKLYSLLGIVMIAYVCCIVISVGVNKLKLPKYKNMRPLKK